MSLERSVSVIYQDLLRRTQKGTFTKGIIIAFFVGGGWELIEYLLKLILKGISADISIGGGLYDSFIAGVLALLIYLGRNFKKINEDCKELEGTLSIFEKSHPTSKLLLTNMRQKAYIASANESEKNQIRERVDPKLFSSLDYGRRIVTKTPPPIRLDEDYIDDIFHPQTEGIYTLWSEEPSFWLDPMMQFYLTNIGIRNLKDWLNSKSTGNTVQVVNRDSIDYQRFTELSVNNYKSIRIVLVKQDWIEKYRDELAVLVAICELFRIPCYLICNERVINYLKSDPAVEANLKRRLTDIDSLIKGRYPLTETKFILNLEIGLLDIMGLLIIRNSAGNKFYIFTDDVSRPFKPVEDNSMTGFNLFHQLLEIYNKCPYCRISLPDDRLNIRHVMLD